MTPSLFKPILAAAMAVLFANCTEGCLPKPPGAGDLEKQYNDQLTECVVKAATPKESCECRKAVDESWGLCDRPEWPRIGRCDFICE